MEDEHDLEKKIDEIPPIPHYSSLHELRVTQNAVRTEPGRYRIFEPPPYVDLMPEQPSTSRSYINNRTRGARRPYKAIGDGQILGKSELMEAGAFIKSAELLSSNITKKYYPDDEEIESELNLPHSSKKSYRVVTSSADYNKHGEDKEILEEEVHEEGHHVIHEDVDKILVEQGECDHHSEYTEETVEVEIEEPDQDITYSVPYEHSTIYRPRLSLAPQIQLLKKLRGENNFLKEQLDCVQYKVKQLEHLLVDRNMRMRSLLAENVQLGIKLRRITSEIGEDTVKEILEAQPVPSPRKRKTPANRR